MFVEFGSSMLNLPKGKKSMNIDLLTNAAPGSYIALWGHSKNGAFQVERQVQIAAIGNRMSLKISKFTSFTGFDELHLSYFVTNSDRIPSPLEYEGKAFVTRHILIKEANMENESPQHVFTKEVVQRVINSALEPMLDNIREKQKEIVAGKLTIEECEEDIEKDLPHVDASCYQRFFAELAKKNSADIFDIDG